MGLSVASRLATYADARDARRKEMEDVCRTCENRPWSPYALPHGAKGIEGDGFAVEFRADKIVFVPKADSKATHYTLHTGANSGVIDLHATGGDGETHRTLFAIRKDDLFGLLQEMAPIVPELLGLLRPLRLGWLKHRNIGIARGIEPVADAEIAAVTRKRKKRLTLDPELYCQNIDCPEFLEDVYDFPDGNFTLLHKGRAIGMGLKKTLRTRGHSLILD